MALHVWTEIRHGRPILKGLSAGGENSVNSLLPAFFTFFTGEPMEKESQLLTISTSVGGKSGERIKEKREAQLSMANKTANVITNAHSTGCLAICVVYLPNRNSCPALS